MRRRLVFLNALLIVAGGLWYLAQAGYLFSPIDGLTRTQSLNQVALWSETLNASGTIEARHVALVSQVSGQIMTLNVHEGDLVKSGDQVASLDTALMDAQVASAQAAVDAAQANLAQVKAGTRPEIIQQAHAALDKALAARDATAQALKDAELILSRPQELDAQIAQARAQLALAQAGVKQAEAQIKAAQVTVERYQGATSDADRAQFQAAEAQKQAAEGGLIAALAARDGAQAILDLLLKIRANPIALNTQVHTAQARSAQANAGVALAQANLNALLAGATPEQIDVAQAQVAQAQAALEQLQVQHDKMILRAPVSGLVTALPVHLGENVQAGTRLMTISDLDAVRIELYIPETEMGRVKVGQTVNVRVDGLPDRIFEGSIYYISPNAEFTPTTVQTKEERAKTVFMVKVRLANPDRVLKPGMPADAAILVQ